MFPPETSQPDQPALYLSLNEIEKNKEKESFEAASLKKVD